MEREGRGSSKTPILEHSSVKGTVHHPFPMNFVLKPWKLGQWVYQVIKFGIVQYVSLVSFLRISNFVAGTFTLILDTIIY